MANFQHQDFTLKLSTEIAQIAKSSTEAMSSINSTRFMTDKAGFSSVAPLGTKFSRTKRLYEKKVFRWSE